MKTLQLPPNPRDIPKKRADKVDQTSRPAPLVSAQGAQSKSSVNSLLDKLFPDDSLENLSTTEAVIRGALVFTMPVLSSIDWNYHTHTMIFIAPIIFYLEVTAFTMYCPIKRLFSNYSHPSKYE